MPSIRLNNEIRSRMQRKAADMWETAHPEIEIPAVLIEKLRTALLSDPLVVKAVAFAQANIDLIKRQVNSTACLRVKNVYEPTDVTRIDVYLPTHRFSTRVTFPTPIKVPLNLGWTPDLYLNELPPEMRSEIIDEYGAHVAAVKERADAFHTYKTKVNGLINNVNTTGQFLEAWPAGVELLPQEVITKMHTKVTRKGAVKNIKEKVEFDDADASAVLMTAKIIGG